MNKQDVVDFINKGEETYPLEKLNGISISLGTLQKSKGILHHSKRNALGRLDSFDKDYLKDIVQVAVDVKTESGYERKYLRKED